MTVEANPPRELASDRLVRQAVGGQLIRVALMCVLSLAIGIVIGQYFLRKQMQIQNGAVTQLQDEIRGLTGDIQRLELAGSRSVARFENAVREMQDGHRIDRVNELQQTQQRLASLERLVQRQITSLRSAQTACLAEFAQYDQKKFAVPVDQIADALERMAQRRTDDLGALIEEIEAHSELERHRMAAIESQWVLSSHSTGARTSTKSALTQHPRGFPVAAAEFEREATEVDHASRAELNEQGIPLVIAAPRSHADELRTESGNAESAAFSAASESQITFSDATQLEPIVEVHLPALRIASTANTPGPRVGLLSFASGRRVQGATIPADLEAEEAATATANVDGPTEIR